VQDTYGRRVAWKGPLPVQILMATDWPVEYETSATRAAQAWNQAAGREIISVLRPLKAVASLPTVDQRNGLYYFTQWPDSSSSFQALTKLLFAGDSAVDADIRINAHNFAFFDTIASGDLQVHMESLLIHEMGHLLGLKHFMNPPTVMAPSLAANFVRTQISESDKESLHCEYNP
jgi:hypothetical protein